MPRRSMKQRKYKQNGGGYHMPSEYFGHESGAFGDLANVESSIANTESTIANLARQELNVFGNDFSQLTGIQTGGARKRRRRKSRKQRGGNYNRPSEYFGSNSGQYVDQTLANTESAIANLARQEINVLENDFSQPTGIQTGGARAGQRRRRSYRKRRRAASRRGRRFRSSRCRR